MDASGGEGELHDETSFGVTELYIGIRRGVGEIAASSDGTGGGVFESEFTGDRNGWRRDSQRSIGVAVTPVSNHVGYL